MRRCSPSTAVDRFPIVPLAMAPKGAVGRAGLTPLMRQPATLSK